MRGKWCLISESSIILKKFFLSFDDFLMTTWEQANRSQRKKEQENPDHGRGLIQKKNKRGESAESLERYCNSIVQFIRYCHVCPYVNFELYTIVGILKVLYIFFSLRYRWPLQIWEAVWLSFQLLQVRLSKFRLNLLKFVKFLYCDKATTFFTDFGQPLFSK